MKLVKHILIVVFVFTFAGAKAMSGKEYLKRIRQNYETLESLKVEMEYSLYKGFSGDSIIEQYSSEYCRIGDNAYRRIDAVEIITVDGTELTVDHSEKKLAIAPATNFSMIDASLKKSLKMCSNIHVDKSKKNTLVTLMISPKADLPYVSICFEIDSKYFLKETTIYYRSKINFAPNYFEQDYDFPKLVIRYDQFKNKWKDKEGLLNMGKFVRETPQGLAPEELFKNYHLLDLRK